MSSSTISGAKPVRFDQRRGTVRGCCDIVAVADVTRFIVLEAARGVREHQLSYYDAQIWATARLNQVPVIFTEDLESGRRLEGVEFLDPLAPGFDLTRWS